MLPHFINIFLKLLLDNVLFTPIASMSMPIEQIIMIIPIPALLTVTTVAWTDIYAYTSASTSSQIILKMYFILAESGEKIRTDVEKADQIILGRATARSWYRFTDKRYNVVYRLNALHHIAIRSWRAAKFFTDVRRENCKMASSVQTEQGKKLLNPIIRVLYLIVTLKSYFAKKHLYTILSNTLRLGWRS